MDLCDDEGVPLICPKCQVLAHTGDRLLLCMGLFSIFLVGSQSDAAWLRESCPKPHTPARLPLKPNDAPGSIRTFVPSEVDNSRSRSNFVPRDRPFAQYLEAIAR
jgi:hypothetical protein